ncbi:hypothetical protein OHC33_000067 [Knufia fluminis]|uniref:Uncharacterized protein n=1 Tax=Knufia fluminis TaxID=191047 RepID=A0AAN8EPL5_9EURO|nr:hypothetical protein OHC33_000067 [Knufia fluminis]
MQLRNSIIPPARYDEEDHSSRHLPEISSRAWKVMQPQYPLLLKSGLVEPSAKAKPSPAVFPSKSLTGTSGVPQGSQNEIVGGKSNGHVYDSEKRVSSPAQDSFPASDTPSEDTQLDENISEMQTSPLRHDVSSATSVVGWNMLDEGLQLYIFNSLRHQHKHTDVVARMLGLSTADLEDLLYLRNQRTIHPLSTDQLWQHCLTMSEGNNGFVDPQVLKQYMPYFSFAQSFESASTYQRKLAKTYLGRRGIEGPWVDALLEHESGIWNRPAGRNVVFEQSQSGIDEGYASGTQSPTGDQEISWQTALRNVQIHESHDIQGTADHLRSEYFPTSTRNDLLGKGTTALNAFEYWLIYGQFDSELHDVQPSIELSTNGVPNTPRVELDPVLYFLRTLFEESTSTLMHPQQRMKQCQHTPFYTYAITRILAQMQLIKKEVRGTPLTREEKLQMLEAAKARCLTNLLRDIHARLVPIDTPVSHPVPSSPVSADSSTLVDQDAMSVETGKSSQSSSRSISPVGPLKEQTPLEKPDVHTIEHEDARSLDLSNLPQRHNKDRSDTLSTDATLPVLADWVTYSRKQVVTDHHAGTTDTDVPGLWQHGTRSPSTESYHTARDEDNDVTMVDLPQALLSVGRKSPSPPPWSPISDINVELERARPDSAASEIPKENSTPTSLVGLGLSLRCSTPWLSAKTGQTNPLLPSTRKSRGSSGDEETAQTSDSTTVMKGPAAATQDQQQGSEAPAPEEPRVADICNSKDWSTDTKNVAKYLPTITNDLEVSAVPATAAASFPLEATQHTAPTQQSMTLLPTNTTPFSGTSSMKTPVKQRAFPTFDIVQTPSIRPSVPAGSPVPKTKKARERATKPAKDEPRPIASKPTPALMSKFLDEPKSPTKNIRRDKGQKRGPHMTKKRKAEAAAKAEEEAAAAKKINTGAVQNGPAPTSRQQEQ